MEEQVQVLQREQQHIRASLDLLLSLQRPQLPGDRRGDVQGLETDQLSPIQSRNPSPVPSVVSSDPIDVDPFADLRHGLANFPRLKCESGHVRDAHMTMAVKLLQSRKFNANVEPLQFRSFLKFFYRTLQQTRADFRDAPSLFQVALHTESVAFLDQISVDFTDLQAMVMALAEKCIPSLTDLVTLMRRFFAETPSGSEPHQFYNKLFQYHVAAPESITPMLVLVHFMNSVSTSLHNALQQSLFSRQRLPNQLQILNLIRAFKEEPSLPSAAPKSLPSFSQLGSSQQPQPRDPAQDKSTKSCHQCHVPGHGAMQCRKQCCQCRQVGHIGWNCPVPCSRCGQSGGHVYFKCH